MHTSKVNSIEVACGIWVKQQQVLLLRRGPDCSNAGYWEFAGGKLEADESVAACLKREWQEELGYEIEVGEILMSSEHTTPTLHIRLHAAWIIACNGEIELREHDRRAWVTATQLLDYQLTPADIPIARRVQAELLGQV